MSFNFGTAFAERREDDTSARVVLPHKLRECLPRAALDEDVIRVGEQSRHGRGEADRFTRMPRPVAGVGRILVAQPVGCDGGENRNRRALSWRICDGGFERRDDGVHHRGVKCVRGFEAFARDAAGGKIGLDGCDGGIGAREHAEFRAVDRGEKNVIAREQRCLGFREAHREHRATRLRLHQVGAAGNDADGILDGENSGERRCDIFADAVADERGGLHAAREPQLREPVAHGEKCGLRDARLAKCVVCIFAAGKNVPAQIERGTKRLVTAIERCAKHGLGRVKLRTHAGVLRALAGEHQDYARCLRDARKSELRFGAAQCGDGERATRAEECTTVRKLGAASLQSVRNIGEREIGMSLDVIGEMCGLQCECSLGFRGNRKDDWARCLGIRGEALFVPW